MTRVLLSLALMSLGGCAASVFPSDVHLSTKSRAIGPHHSLGVVSVQQCAVAVVIIPVLDPWNPSDVYEDLLTKAAAIDADALVDYHVEGGDFAGFYPFFVRGCVRHVATAVRFD